MRRRALLVAVGVDLAIVSAGCVNPFRSDRDGDGSPEADDAAPADPRVDTWVGGDPAPSVEFEVVGRASDSVTIRLQYTGGDRFTPENTGRLELASRGTPVGRIDLPFQAGDRAVVRGVPPGRRVVLVWFPPQEADGEPLVVAAFDVPESTATSASK